MTTHVYSTLIGLRLVWSAPISLRAVSDLFIAVVAVVVACCVVMGYRSKR